MNSTTKIQFRERFRVAVQFLLNCFDSMHHLKMTKSICFILKDVRTFLLGMDSSLRMELFSAIPTAAMDDLGFLKKKMSGVLDLTIVTKEELLLLFIVCHLSLNGKSHFEEVVQDLVRCAPQVISMILSSVSVPGKLGYLWKYPQYFSMDNEGYMELPSTFNSAFEESSQDLGASSDADGTYQSNVLSFAPDGFNSNQDKTLMVKNELGYSNILTKESTSSANSLNKGIPNRDIENNMKKLHTSMELASNAIATNPLSKVEGIEVSEHRDKFLANEKSGLANDIAISFKSLSLDQTGALKTVLTGKNTVTEEGVKKITEDNIKGMQANVPGYSQDMLEQGISKTPPTEKIAVTECNINKSPEESVKGLNVSGCLQGMLGQGFSKTLPPDKKAVAECSAEKSSEETVEGVNVSGYSQDMLDYLIVRLHQSIVYLLQFFELNVYSQFLEVVLHVLKDCALFFYLSFEQQLSIIRAIFLAFDIDRQGKVTYNFETKQKELKLSDLNKMLLCISYIVSQGEYVHYQHVFRIYYGLIKETKHLNDSDQLEYFKKRLDIFFLPGDIYFGLVRLVNICPIKFDYVSILMSDRNYSPVTFNPGLVMPRTMPRPVIFNPGVAGARLNCRPDMFNTNAFVPQMFCNPVGLNTDVAMPGTNFAAYRTCTVMPRMNCSPVAVNAGVLRMPPPNYSPMVFNPGALRPPPNCRPMVVNAGALGPPPNYRPMVINAGALGPPPNYRPMVVNAGALGPPPNYRPLVVNADVLRKPPPNCSPMVNTGSLGSPPNCMPMIVNAGALGPPPNSSSVVLNTGALKPPPKCSPMFLETGRSQTNCSGSNKLLEKNGNRILNSEKIVDTTNDKTFNEGSSLAVIELLTGKDNASVKKENVSDEIMTLNVTNEEEEMKRVKYSIFYLSQAFVLGADDLTLILFILEDVQNHLQELNVQGQEDFVEKCVNHLFSNPNNCSPIAASKPDLLILNEEEKIALFIALLLSSEKEMHYEQLFDKFYECNASMLPCRKSILDQHEFVTKWKRVFSLSPNGNVKLLPFLVKNVSSIDEASCATIANNSLAGTHDKFKFETGDGINEFLEKNSTSQDNSIHIKSNQFYNRIMESITYLSKTFECVSAEQIVKTIFYVLHDVDDLFTKKLDVNKSVLEAMYLSFKERKPTHLQEDKLTCEFLNLDQKERNLLPFICILIGSPTMHYQKLFNISESHVEYELMTSAEQYAYIEKNSNYFVIDCKGNVSLKENKDLMSFDLEGFLKDVDLKSSFQSALLERSDTNAFTLAESRCSQYKSSSSNIQHDVLCAILDICNDVISFYQPMQCNTNSLHLESSESSSDVQSKIQAEPKPETTISLGATKNKTELNTSILMDSSTFPPSIHSNSSGPAEQSGESITRHTASIFNLLETELKSESTFSVCATKNKTERNQNIEIDSSKASPYIHPSIKGSTEKSITRHTTPIFNLLKTELKSEGTFSLCATKNKTERNDNIELDSSETSPCIHPSISGSTEKQCDKTMVNKLSIPPPGFPPNIRSVQHCDKTITIPTKPIFNMLEMLSDDEQPEVVPCTSSESIAYPSIASNCGCTKDSSKELRAVNFFSIMLNQSTDGFSVSALKEKLLFASQEVQHYMSCVYKNDILIFLQNHGGFYVSPTSGNIFCKKSK